MEDIVTMGEAVGALLKERGQTVSVAESSAGGLTALLCYPSPAPPPTSKGVGSSIRGSRNIS